MMRFAKRKGQQPEAHAGTLRSQGWAGPGAVDQLASDKPPVGHETPSDFAARMDERAEKDGAAVLPDSQTIASDAPPVKEAREAAEVRAKVAKKSFIEKLKGLNRTIAEAPSKAQKLLTRAVLLNDRLPALGKKLDDRRKAIPPLREEGKRLKREMGELPFYRRGLVSSIWVPATALAGVSLFDVAVIKSALNQTALDSLSIWLTTIGVALLFAVLNEAFGLLAGVLVRKAGFRRPALLGATMFVGLAGLLISVVMLGWFRHETAIDQNQSLTEIAAGRTADLHFIIDPLFLAPLQAVGCMAAMVVVALYSVSIDWRRLRDEANAVKKKVEDAEAKVAETEGEIDATRRAAENAFLEAYEIQGAAAGASASIDAVKDEGEAVEGAERALGREMVERYRAERNYVKGIYDNGNVHRCAMPTKFSWGRRGYTPAPSDREGGRRETPARSNGHSEEAVDPDQLTFGWKGGQG